MWKSASQPVRRAMSTAPNGSVRKSDMGTCALAITSPRGWAGVVLGKVVGDLEPRRLRADEDVLLQADPRVVVERAHRHHRDVAIAVEPRQLRPAAAAEYVL